MCGADAAKRVEQRWNAWTATHSAPAPDIKTAAADDINEVRLLPTQQSKTTGGVSLVSVASQVEDRPLDLDEFVAQAVTGL